MTQDELKKQVSQAALRHVVEDAIVGVGSGSTVNLFIDALAAMKGRIEGAVAASEASAERLKRHGIHVFDLNAVDELPVYVDGADEIDPALDLIKGLGGALVREKVVAHASRQVIIIVDESKLSERLGLKAPIPVETVSFAVDVVRAQLLLWGGDAKLREKEGKPFVSDNGNFVLDWWHGPIDQPWALEKQVKGMTGVVDSGIFANVASQVIAATSTGIRKLQRPPG